MVELLSYNKDYYQNKLDATLRYLEGKQRILLLTTSNRWSGIEGEELPKSTRLAHKIKGLLVGREVKIIDVPSLNLYPCEGNVSTKKGNSCGEKKAVLLDEEKNPTGYHRCWASINNPDDDLWKVSKTLFDSDCVVFFGSVRWGHMNSFYQKLIERLTWIENRHSTLGEDNIVKDVDAGIIVFGQNWNGENVLKTQKQVISFLGFKLVEDLCWNWKYTENFEEESPDSYVEGAKAFDETFFIKN